MSRFKGKYRIDSVSGAVLQPGEEDSRPVQRLRLRYRPTRDARLRGDLSRRQASRPERKDKTGARKNRWKPGTPLREGRWNKFHRDVFTCERFANLSRTAKLLLLHLFAQWTGFDRGDGNNGRLQATLTWLKRECGWGDSPRSLAHALSELIEAGFITRERNATRSRAAWYALTWVDGEEEDE